MWVRLWWVSGSAGREEEKKVSIAIVKRNLSMLIISIFDCYTSPMSNILFCKGVDRLGEDYECVERKGVGHPDSLADRLAEYLSVEYSKYTMSHFGAVLHHNFDKVGLLGGRSCVKFGTGKLIKPIRVILNGRASSVFAGKKIPLKKLLEEWSSDFLCSNLPLLRAGKDIEFHYFLSTSSSPGGLEGSSEKEEKRRYWFEPRGLYDLSELVSLRSNDTSFGCGYAPLSILEKSVLKIENELNGRDYKKKNAWIGSDIKVAGTRFGRLLSFTLCVPQIATRVHSVEDYKNNLKKVKKDILRIIGHQIKKEFTCELHINTRDDFQIPELYLTAIGSSLESGDEGLVGRGNRVNGLITLQRPMSMEGVSGKNPVYHIGKLYNLVAFNIADAIYRLTGQYVEVSLVSQSGRSLVDPWKIFVSSRIPSRMRGGCERAH